MAWICYVGLFICLAVVIIQDLRYRYIHVVPPIVFFTTSIYLVQDVYQISQVTIIVLYNLIFFLITFSILVVYMSIKNKRFLNPLKNYFGLGDVIFYIAVSPVFLLYNFVLFFILSLVFSFILHVFLARYQREKTVPLAGYSGIFLGLVMIGDVLLKLHDFTLL